MNLVCRKAAEKAKKGEKPEENKSNKKSMFSRDDKYEPNGDRQIYRTQYPYENKKYQTDSEFFKSLEGKNVRNKYLNFRC